MPEVTRRGVIAGAAAMALPIPSFAQTSDTLPAPIGVAERLARLARARLLMERHGIGSVLIESGPSLDYFTGIQWWRSERPTAVILTVSGDPVIVTPFFEGPTISEMLGVPAEIRTWQENEEPLELVAALLRERGLANSKIGFEETNRYFLLDRLRQRLPRASVVSANPVVCGCRMVKTAAELALMGAAARITVAALAQARGELRAGMTPGEIDELIARGHRSRGAEYDGGLVLLDEASAYPHGSKQKFVLKKGSLVLLDCGGAVHGYQSDISRTFIFDGDPTPEQRRVWQQMRHGQEIAMAAAKIDTPAGHVDDAVRATYTRWGYGPGYRLPGLSHRTGHGIGMEGHEPVNLVQGETTPLAEGMCFSNEPGIYLPGKFGIRLEDCFHMTAAGPEWFTVPPATIDQPFS